MSNQDTPREIKILADNLCKLQAFAWQAVYYRNLGLGEFVLFSVEANSRWSNLADFLLKQLDEVFPVDNYDDLVINGFATPALLEVISSCMPHLRNEIFRSPAAGLAKLCLLTDDGVSVHEVEPKNGTSHLH